MRMTKSGRGGGSERIFWLILPLVEFELVVTYNPNLLLSFRVEGGGCMQCLSLQVWSLMRAKESLETSKASTEKCLVFLMPET